MLSQMMCQFLPPCRFVYFQTLVLFFFYIFYIMIKNHKQYYPVAQRNVILVSLCTILWHFQNICKWSAMVQWFLIRTQCAANLYFIFFPAEVFLLSSDVSSHHAWLKGNWWLKVIFSEQSRFVPRHFWICFETWSRHSVFSLSFLDSPIKPVN